MTFRKCGFIVALTLAFAATPLLINTVEAKVTKGQASVAKRSGKLYITQRQYDKALEQYMIAVEGRPDDSEAQYYLGWLYGQKELFEEMNEHYDLATDRKWKKKVAEDRKELWTRYYNLGVKGMNAQKFEFAVDQFNLAITINPKEADAYEGLAITLLNVGNSEEGIETYKKALELDPSKAQSYFNVGGALMNADRVEEALEMFKKGHAIDPEEINILQNLAIAHYRAILAHKEGASESAEKALAIAGDDPKILNIAAQIFLQAENYEKAAEILEKVVAIQPDNMDALFNLAIAYRQLGKGDKALNLPKEADAYEGLAITLLNVGNSEEGIETYKKALELDPSKAQSYFNVGGALMNADRVEEALEMFKKGHAIDPEEINILQNLAIAHYRAILAHKEGASESAEKALAIAGDDPKILNIAAQIFLQAENYEKAAEILEKVVAIQPDNMDALFNLAIAYRQLGKGDKALNLFQKSVESNPDDIDSWYQLGLLADKVESFDKAIEAFTKVTELQADNARAWAALSRVYARKSEVSEGDVAEECVKKATEAFQMYEALQSQSNEE